MQTRTIRKYTPLSMLALGLALAMPSAFAQEAEAEVVAGAEAALEAGVAGGTPGLGAQAQVDGGDAVPQATPATPATPPATAGDAAIPATPATPPARSQRTWAELDVDADGQLSLEEAGEIESLAAVFTQADADADGQLTADEYKAYLATHHGAKAQSGTSDG